MQAEPHPVVNDTPAVNTPQDEPLVYDIPSVAKLLKISNSLCYRLCRAGQIPGVLHLGKRTLISRYKLENYLGKGAAGD